MCFPEYVANERLAPVVSQDMLRTSGPPSCCERALRNLFPRICPERVVRNICFPEDVANERFAEVSLEMFRTRRLGERPGVSGQIRTGRFRLCFAVSDLGLGPTTTFLCFERFTLEENDVDAVLLGPFCGFL
jgi:hypothetical protein